VAARWRRPPSVVWPAAMPMTLAELKEIQDEYMADDVEIPPEAVAWVPSEARKYFESGGMELPKIWGGFEGAEIHAHYELAQRRFESTDSDAMLDALSEALFKTTGDENFKPAEKAPEPESYGTRPREEYEPILKYPVPKTGDGVKSMTDKDGDDCM